MVEIGNHAAGEPWPSLEWASWIFDRASFVLAGSLVFGALATGAIVWMGIVKEHHWDRLRDASNEKVAALESETAKANAARAKSDERIAELQTQSDKAKAEIADAVRQTELAKAAAAEANQKAEAERLERLKLEARVAPRRLSSVQVEAIRLSLSSVPKPPMIAIVSRLLDSEGKDFADDIAGALTSAGWASQQFVNWTMSDKGLFVAMAAGSSVRSDDPTIVGLKSALSSAALEPKVITIEAKNLATSSPHFEPNVLYVLVGAKP